MMVANSKKATAASAGTVIAAVAAHFGYPIEVILTVLSPIISYILGQGIADIGKKP